MPQTEQICSCCGHPKDWHIQGHYQCSEMATDRCEIYNDGARSKCCAAKIVGIGSVCQTCGAPTGSTAHEWKAEYPALPPAFKDVGATTQTPLFTE